MTSNVFPMSYLEPCFLLSSHRFDFPPPVYAPLILIFFLQGNLSLSLHLVLLAPINSFFYFIVYLVLAFCSCIPVAVCLLMTFFILKRIYIYTHIQGFFVTGRAGTAYREMKMTKVYFVCQYCISMIN